MLKELNSCRRYQGECETKATGCGQDVCAYGYVLPEKFIFVMRDVWGRVGSQIRILGRLHCEM